MKYKVILFDLDGTLVDSIGLWTEAYLATFNDWGFSFTEDEFLKRIYNSSVHLSKVLAGTGKEQHEAVFRAERDARYIALLSQKVEWLEGAEAVLQAVADQYPIGLVTGSWQSYVDAIDHKLNVLHYFQQTVVCDETVRKGKPDPYPLMLAAEKFAVKPEDCLYIGDQWFDTQAANDAGMPMCLVKAEYTPPEAEEGAEFVVEGIGDVMDILKST